MGVWLWVWGVGVTAVASVPALRGWPGSARLTGVASAAAQAAARAPVPREAALGRRAAGPVPPEPGAELDTRL